jgi:predicted acetyltransferase
VTDDITIEVPTEADWDEYDASISTTFNGDVDEEISALERTVWEPERSLVARRDGRIVGTAGIYTRRLCVPGGSVPAAHVTLVSVAPTARRQGVLTRFMKQQFLDAQAAGEPVAVLWASEARIYQRFGYGLAVRKMGLTVNNREVTMTAPVSSGRIRSGTPSELRDDLIKVYEQVYGTRPGWSERTAKHWDYRLSDPKEWRHGATQIRVVVHEGDAGVDGYAIYRVKAEWGDTGPSSQVQISEHVASNTEAYLALWNYLLNLDLTRSARKWNAAVDDPLFALANEPRHLGATLSDALWVRLIDVPAALAARQYLTDVDVVLDVTDELIPANSGRWHLVGSADKVTCTRTEEDADIAGDVRVFGAAYLGGVSLSALADAGLIREVQPGTLAKASVAFGWHRAPSAVEVF